MTGVVNVAWNLAVGQAAAGHDVEIVAPRDNPQHDRQIARVKLRWLPQWQTWRTARFDFSYLIPLYLFTLRSRRVDVTHVHSNPYLLLTLPKSRVQVLHFQNSPVHGSTAYEHAIARANVVICCSQFIRQQLLEEVTYPPSQIHVVHNGATLADLSNADRVTARSANHIADDQIVLLYVARIAPEKGLHVLVDALAEVVAQSDVRPLLLVAGSGTLGHEGHKEAWPELQTYERLVRQRSSSLPVRFLGNVSRRDLPALYRAADIFICPSTYQEPFGMVNVEAAAAGLPVIASAVGGIPEAVVDNENGLLVPPNDFQSLADAIIRLASDHSLRSRMGRTAQDFASQFDWRLLTSKVLAHYDNALWRAGSTRRPNARVAC